MCVVYLIEYRFSLITPEYFHCTHYSCSIHRCKLHKT